MYIHITQISLSLSLSPRIYIYIYTHREREGEIVHICVYIMHRIIIKHYMYACIYAYMLCVCLYANDITNKNIDIANCIIWLFQCCLSLASGLGQDKRLCLQRCDKCRTFCRAPSWYLRFATATIHLCRTSHTRCHTYHAWCHEDWP